MAPVLVANATAAEPKVPKIMEGSALNAVSPNGKYAAGEYYGSVSYVNLETGAETFFSADEMGSTQYGLGVGNCISNDGILICSDDMNGSSSYYDGTEWKYLDIGETNGVNTGANAITPDGSRICGDLGLREMTMEDVTMCVPVIWDRLSDGTYGEYVRLPHPELDPFGRAPQYVTATHISDDGHTILGQITDCRGYYRYPIVYKEAADGTWSYILPYASTFNPNHVTIPEYPGEGPRQPQATDYMTEQEKADWDQAMADWRANGYKQDEYPNENDFLSPEAKAEYQAALDKYNEEAPVWSEKWDAYNTAYWDALDGTPNFESNQNALASDGSAIGCTEATEGVPDPTSWGPIPMIYTPYIYDLTTGEYVKYEGKNMSICGYAGKYWMAVATDDATSCYLGYMLRDGNVIDLYDFLASKETVKEWMDTNMNHQFESFDYETETVVTTDLLVTGLPHASADLRVFVTWTLAGWSGYDPVSYVFDLGEGAAISETFADKKAAMFDADGNLVLGADVKAVAIYDVAGRCVKNAAAQTVACGDLADGVYIVNVTYADGTAASVKIAK